MAYMEPNTIPCGRHHLDEEDLALLTLFEAAFGEQRFTEAHDLLEDLWITAYDAHKGLYQGMANAIAAIEAESMGHHRGANEIAVRSHQMLEPFPRRALGIDLDHLLTTMDAAVRRS